MKDVTFISGNINKINYLNKFFDEPLKHEKVDLDEIQTLDIHELVQHKVREAYRKIGKPVLVEDVGLEFTSFGRLPGTFVKFFLQEMSLQQICDLLKDKDRGAVGKCVFGYFDGVKEKYFEGHIDGKIAETPGEVGDHGYGWDQIFIPEGYDKVRSELSMEDNLKTYLKIKPIEEVRGFLES